MKAGYDPESGGYVMEPGPPPERDPFAPRPRLPEPVSLHPPHPYNFWAGTLPTADLGILELAAESHNGLIAETAIAAGRVLATLAAKNHDYAGEDPWRNFDAAELAGVNPARAILVRLLDKVARISTLLDAPDGPAVAGEALADSGDDLIGYALILRAWLSTHTESKGE